MNDRLDAGFRWEDLSEDEKELLRAAMRARLTEPDLSLDFSAGAGDSALDPETLRIRAYVASNPNTPAPVLHHLAKTGTPQILERIAENPRAHQATLTGLADHPHPDVRARVAENHNTPLEVLQSLCEDPNPYVACRSQRTLSRLARDAMIVAPAWGGTDGVHRELKGG